MADKPEIKIGADLSQANKAVDEFGKNLENAAKPVVVDVVTSEAEKNLEALTAQAEEAAKAAALPGAAAGVRKLAEELEKARKIQDVLAREGIKISRDQANAARAHFDRWRDSGARGTRQLRGQGLDDFLGGGWRGSALNEADARRTRAQVMQAVGLNGMPGAPGGGGGGGPGPRGLGAYAGHALAQAGRGAAGQVLPSGGYGGSIIQGGVSEAAGAGGLFTGAGMARLAVGGIVGAAAFGAMKLIGGIAGKIGTANDESVHRTDLLRSLGGATDEFDQLKQSAQALAQGLSITANEADSLAHAYGAGSGTTQGDRGRVFGEAGEAGSFARQTGSDVGSSVGMFAELRRTGQDSPEKMGRAVADAISKRGDFGRLSEVLGNLTQFSSTVANASLTRGNADNMLDVASRLASLNLPGMGTAEGIGHMAAMDAGFRGGGGGPAADQLMMQTLRRGGMQVNGYDIQSVREAGLLANNKDVFGQSSPSYMAAKAAGNQSEMARLDDLSKNGKGRVLDTLMAGLKSQFGNNGQAITSALMNVTGGSKGDSEALQAGMANGGGTEGILARLKKAGYDTSSMNVSQMIGANGVLGASKDELFSRRDAMLGRSGADKLKAEDADKLKAAGNDPEALRKVLTELASKDTMQTEGDKTRASLNSIQIALDAMASKIAELLTPIRDVMVKMAVKAGLIDQDQADTMMGMTPIKKLEKRRDELQAQIGQQPKAASFDESGNPIADDSEHLKEQLAVVNAALASEQNHARIATDPAYANAAKSEAGKQDYNIAALAAKKDDKLDPIFSKAAKDNGVDMADLKLLAARESRMKAGATNENANGSTDYGIMQHNSQYLAARGLSIADAMNPEKAIPAGAKLWKQLLGEAHGDKQLAAQRWNGGGSNSSASVDYGAHWENSRHLYDAATGSGVAMGDTAGPTAEKANTKRDGSPTVEHSHKLSVDITGMLSGGTMSIPDLTLHDGKPVPAGGAPAGGNWFAKK